MGILCSSELRRGHINITMKLILLTVFVAVSLTNAVPEAEPGLAYFHNPFGHYAFAPYGFAPYVYAVPTLPELLALEGTDEGVGAHPAGATSWTQRSAQGASERRRRSAEPEADPALVYGYPYVYPAYPAPLYQAVVPAAAVPVVPALEPLAPLEPKGALEPLKGDATAI